MKLLACLLTLALPAAAQTEKLRNDRVVITEDTLAPGESRALPDIPSVTVYLTAGTLGNAAVKRGGAVFEPARPRNVKNTGRTEIKWVRIEFRSPGLADTWGAAGLAPNYKVLLENRFARVYDIRIPAGGTEPRHTHHDRVVVCLSGAQLEHVLPDGRIEPSSLATGEIAWRGAATHAGHNLGKTDLWVIAVEPK